MAPKQLYHDDAFRAAARRLFPKSSVSPVAPVANVDGGAFVETSVFVPDAEAAKDDRKEIARGA